MLVVVVALVLAEGPALVLVSDELVDPEPHPKSASVAAQVTATARDVIRFVFMVPQSSSVPCRAGGGCWN